MTALRALLLGILSWSIYIAVRTFAQRAMPFTDWPSYVRQDMVITVARLACASAALWIASRRWRGPALGFGGFQLGSAGAWAAAALLVTAMVLGGLAQQQGPPLVWVRAAELLIA